MENKLANLALGTLQKSDENSDTAASPSRTRPSRSESFGESYPTTRRKKPSPGRSELETGTKKPCRRTGRPTSSGSMRGISRTGSPRLRDTPERQVRASLFIFTLSYLASQAKRLFFSLLTLQRENSPRGSFIPKWLQRRPRPRLNNITKHRDDPIDSQPELLGRRISSEPSMAPIWK